MITSSDRWAELRSARRWADLWADVAATGTDDDVRALMVDMLQHGELEDADARRMAVEAFKRTAQGQATHRRNLETARGLAEAGR